MSSEESGEMFDEGDKRNTFSKLFILNKILGKGAYGTVVSAVQRSTQKEFAVKIIQKSAMDQIQYDSFLKEAEILQQLNHRNIVKFEKIIESETRVFLVMELVNGGQLQEYIEQRHRQKNPIKDEEAATIMRAIFSALQEIHSKDVIHRDLKPQNILLADQNDLESIKICDFGLSVQYDPMLQMASFTERCGTRIFMAPELWHRKQYSKPVDMWSCGIIMYMLLSGGRHPVYEHHDTDISYFAKLENPQWKFPPTFNKYSKDLFYKLVCVDPISRYTVEQIQNHPWITRRFNETIPLTSPEKMKAFSHSQILSRVLKSMYVLYNMPGTNIELDPQYQQKIIEKAEKNSEDNSCRKTSSFAESLKNLFETMHTESTDLNLTSSASNQYRDSNSPSPISMYGHSSQSMSPKFPSPVFGGNQLIPIPESETLETHENTPNPPEENRLTTRAFLNEDSFCLPEGQQQQQTQPQNTKKLQFTLSVLPVRYEESSDASQPKANTYHKIVDTSLDDGMGKTFGVKKTRVTESEDKESVRKSRNHTSIIGGAATGAAGSGPTSKIPSPSHKSPNTSMISKNMIKKYYLKNPLEADPVESGKVSFRKEDKLAEILKEPRKSPKIQPSKSIAGSVNAVKDITVHEAMSKTPLKTRSPLLRRQSKDPKLEDIKVKDQRNVKLPAIAQDLRGRNVVTIKREVVEQKMKVNESRVSLSPLKTAKEWSPTKNEKTIGNIYEKGNHRVTGGNLAAILEPALSQTFTKK